MKGKKLLLVTVLLLVLVASAQAQFGIRTGIKAGYSWSDLTGDVPSGTEKLKKFTGGAALEMNLLLISVEADLLYSPRGVVNQDGSETNLNYLSIPVVAKLKLFPMLIHPYLLAGPEFSYLLSAKSNGTDIKDSVKGQDMGIVIGGGLEFSILGKAAYAEARYVYGLRNISTEESTTIRNRVTQIYFGFLL